MGVFEGIRWILPHGTVFGVEEESAGSEGLEVEDGVGWEGDAGWGCGESYFQCGGMRFSYLAGEELMIGGMKCG